MLPLDYYYFQVNKLPAMLLREFYEPLETLMNAYFVQQSIELHMSLCKNYSAIAKNLVM